MTLSAELVSLLKEYQKQLPDSEGGIAIKNNIITKLSRSCWWGKYISNLFPEEVNQNKAEFQQEFKAKLEVQIIKNNDCFKLAKSIINEANLLIKKYEKELITDRFVNQLAIVVKKTSANSPQIIKAKQRLIMAMDILNTYKRKGLGVKFDNLSARDYQEAFNAAKNESISYVLKRIEDYDESKSFMALVNYWIPLNFSDAVGRIVGIKKSQSNKSKENKIYINSEDPTTAYFANKLGNNEEYWSYNQKSQDIKKSIKEDPKFQKPIRKDRPDKTFADILIAKFWHEKTYKELVEEWNIPKSTIQSCFEREIAELIPYLREILK